MSKLQIKQVSGKPAVKYSDIEPGVVFTFNDGSVFGNTMFLKVQGGRIKLSDNYMFIASNMALAEALCTVYKSTLTMEV